MLNKRAFLAGLCALGLTALQAPVQAPAHAAETYPNKPVTYIVTFNPGGASDIAARMQQKYFEKEAGTQAVIQYMPGGGGAQAWSRLNDMEGDGYTIMGTNLPNNILQPMTGNVGYKTDDINTVNLFQYTPNVVAVTPDSPFKTLNDLLDYAKKNPGALTFSGSGSKGGDEVMKERLDEATGVKTTYIPFTGTTPATAALLGKQVNATVTYSTEAVNQGDKLRILAVAAEERLPSLPDAPTFKELGIDLVGGAYRGVGVPASTPEERRKQVSAIISKISNNPDFVNDMRKAGFVPIDVPYEEVPAFMAKQKDIISKVAARVGLTGN